ncbi:RNA polymerase sporulation sigma factor SigE [Romboutsia sp. 1001216sp1]|nr:MULTISPECIES: RNA polymerase sporulation sigma factor SigE [Romboutsia]MCH1961063.1 RNA polymerase sporulation sigma factor SigE [Romboutsia hominis]MDB8789436.1 RNA polymerase sporulation sigma factor SigE [Romboutsia sp. 1001216sp1]MDB8792819.1 RNA polymerase sporulation sigma factor SigE [Romboutsia sp. 1001216sp1]MDB8795379.1 RNA polymerase sporulation sigma factor SigE [Romboutsia sp. 1001216sp1]MDB8799189.1 RNA polymerase sporulation sigma factor SigE [Romboutsia sp. 1001216sp1]
MKSLIAKLSIRIKKILIKFKILKPKGVYYMGGVNVLPPPLNSDEESELLQRLEKDEEVKTILIERNLRLVVYISRKFENTGIDIEDLISIGTIGLIKAVNTFKLNKNIKLATYASRCIENEILMYLRKNNKKKVEVSFDEPLNIDLDGNELLLSDVLGTENDEIYKIIEEEIDKDLLVMALDRLSDREKQIMELRFGLINRGREKTQKEVANILGISQSYISRLEKKIISRLKKEMKKFI